MTIFRKLFNNRIKIPNNRVSLQYLTLFIIALLLTRCWLELVDILLFSPRDWGMPKIIFGAKHDFKNELNTKATLMSNKAFTSNDKSKFQVNDTLLVALSYSETFSRDAIIAVLIENETNSQNDFKNELKNLINEKNSSRYKIIVNSNYNPITGIRSFSVDKESILSICKIVKKDGHRWVQSIIEASDSTARSITLIMGLIQGLIYFFFFIGFVFVIIETTTIYQNNKLISDREIIPIFMQEERSSKLQKLINKIRGLRMNISLSEELSPNIVLDLAEPGYKFLLGYSGHINASDMHTVLESASNSILEKINSRFQIIRYFVAGIPSLGFIGTVLGIGQALGTIGVMTSDAPAELRLIANYDLSYNLHVAFDTTLVGLVASIILSLVVDIVETRSVGLVLKSRKYIMENIGNIKLINEDMKTFAG